MLSTEEVASIQTYNKLLEQGKTANEAFNVALSKSSDTVKQMASNAEGASIQLKAMTLSEKMAATGANILRIGLGAIKKIAIVAAINLVIKGLGKLYDKIVQVKKAGQTDISSTDTYDEYISKATEKVETDKKQIQVVKDIATQYKELSNSTISTDKKKEQLLQLQYKLIDSYGSEAKGIDLVNGKYDESIEKLKSLNEEKQKQLIDDSYAKYVKNRKAYNTQSAFLSSDNEDWLLRFNDAYQQLTRKNGSSGTRLFKTTDSNIFGQKSLSFDNARQAADEINKAYEKLINDTDLRTRNKSTWEDYVQKLDEIRVAVNKNADKAEVALSDYAQTVVTTVQQANNIDFSKISKSQYEKWKAELIKNYGQNDDTVISAISDYLGKTYIAAQEQTNTKKSDVFDITQYSEDIDNLQTKVKSLKETLSKLKDGSITQDELIDFTQEYGLTEYINDIPKLQSELENLIQTSPDELINKLWELRKSLKGVDQTRVDNLIASLQQLGDEEGVSEASQKVKELEGQIQALKNTITELDGQIKAIDSQLDGLKTKQSDLQDENSGLQQAYEYLIDQQINKLNDEIEPHQKIIDKYEEQNEKLEYQNQLYQEQLDMVNEKISNYDTAYSTVQKYVEEQKQAIEDEYEAEQKLNNLRNKNKQKVRIYSEQAGWQVGTEDTQEDKENEKDARISALDNYLKKWSDVVDGINGKQDEIIAKQILGSNWRDKINAKDEDIIKTFADTYNKYVNVQKTSLEKKIKANEKDIKNNEKAIKKEQNVIDSKQKVIQKWNDYKDKLSNAVSKIEGSQNKYLKNLQTLIGDEKLSLENRNKNLEDFKTRYSNNIKDINTITNQIKSLEDAKTTLENNKANAENQKSTLENQKSELNDEAKNGSKGNNTYTAKDMATYAVKNKKDKVVKTFATKSAAEKYVKKAKEKLVNAKVDKEMSKYIGVPPDVAVSLSEKIRKKWEKQLKDYYKISKYKNGGVADYTGIAQLDGTPSKAEVVFSSAQAKKLYDFVANTSNLSEVIGKQIARDLTNQTINNIINNDKTNNSNTNISIRVDKIVTPNPNDFMNQMAQLIRQTNNNRKVGK